MLGEFMSKEALDFMGGTDLLPRHGALVLALDPQSFAARSGRDPIAEGEKLLTAIGAQGARLPSERRFAARRKCRVAFKWGHPQFVCHGLTEFHRLKGSGRGIEEALGSNRQRGGW
jgi:hypothetical protein